MRFLAYVLLTVVALSQGATGDLTLETERFEGDRHYFEWSIEGVDSLRICSGLTSRTPSWFLLREHHSGVWDPLFGFIPLMLDSEGVHWFAIADRIESVFVEAKDDGYLFRTTSDHDIIYWYDDAWITIPGQYVKPVILFSGDPGPNACLSTAPLDFTRKSADEILDAIGPRDADSLLIPFAEFAVVMDEMSFAPVMDRDSVAALDTLYFELSAGGYMGSVNSKQMGIMPSEDLEITVLERFRLNLYYNEYGCGACWLEPRIPGVMTEWIELEEVDGYWSTLEIYESTGYTPVLPPGDYEFAQAWADSQEIEYVVFDSPSRVQFLIRGEFPDGRTVEKFLDFELIPGD